jgi:hypothetical protein
MLVDAVVLDGDRVGVGERSDGSAGSFEVNISDCEPAMGEEMAFACVELKTGSRVHPAETAAIKSNTPASKKKIDIRDIDAPDISSSLA